MHNNSSSIWKTIHVPHLKGPKPTDTHLCDSLATPSTEFTLSVAERAKGYG